MNFQEIDAKWNRIWQEKKCFDAEPNEKKKKLITAAFPYPNSPQHIGHGRTYTTTDVYARYLRLKGYNVLFPMAFHVTGTPIIAMAQRIASRDQEIIKIFSEIYGISKEKTKTLTDPEKLVLYFSHEIEQGMREMGYSIDWRRKFYTFDRKFNAFIQWQFRKLKELGYLVKGEYPIAWCPNDRQAVSAHDTKGDIDPELEQVTVIKFPADDGSGSFVVTTYRPETVYGVTNIWINPNGEYVRAKLNGEIVYIAKKAAEMIGYQVEMDILQGVKAEQLLRVKAKNPMTGSVVPIYPATFVKEDVGTGIVMSVPAHAPYDYLALRDLGKGDIEMPQVIELPGYGKAPAREVVERMGVKNQDDPMAENATNEVYKKEAHEGRMAVGKYKGMPVIQAKEKVAEDLISENNALKIYTIANAPLYCRCGERVIVNILKDQWFIDYGNLEWKERTRNCLSKMRILPEETRAALLATIDWLKTKPCTRAKGLGTRFPFDESKVIEALSDSTIYTAYYTIAHLLSSFDEKEINDALFDYVFLGKGKKKKEWEPLRKSFLYWYPVDSRHSAGDLIRNHLALFIFNHTAIFPEEHWPKQIVTNGFVLMDGAKMSKSMGNILPLRKAIAEYGADVIRLSVVCGADLLHDTDFNRSVADGIRSRLLYFEELLKRCDERSERQQIDAWLLSKLNRRLKRAEALYEAVDLRGVAMELFYELTNDLKWYARRTKTMNLREFFEKWTTAISPFVPHIAEEFWEALDKKGLIVEQEFPAVDEKAIDDKLERAEEFIAQTAEDINRIMELIGAKMGKKPERITLCVADEWKRRLYKIAKEQKEIGKIMAAARTDPVLAQHMKELPTIAKQIIKNIHTLPEPMSEEAELAILNEAAEFFERESGCTIIVERENVVAHERAKNAMPNKPAIIIV
ncbi:MAG: leucine--tRNA ligase [Candidatus Bilamarchaeaceae archaeon]